MPVAALRSCRAQVDHGDCGGSDPGPGQGDPGRRAVLAVLQVVRARRAVGQHQRQPGGVVLRRGGLVRAGPGAQGARAGRAGRPAGQRGPHGQRVRAPVPAAQPGGGHPPAGQRADRRDRPASGGPAADQADPRFPGTQARGQAAPVPGQAPAPLHRRVRSAGLLIGPIWPGPARAEFGEVSPGAGR